MKLLIASDLHGDLAPVEKILNVYEKGNFDQVLLLGDLLYHGPRNDLPPTYAPKRVIPLLSFLKDKVLCVRGNCDAEVDQMVLPFPILEESRWFEADGKKLFLMHGHHALDTTGADVVLSGHTHIPVLERRDGVVFLNPGSPSIPKGGSRPSYALWEDGNIEIRSLEGELMASLEV